MCNIEKVSVYICEFPSLEKGRPCRDSLLQVWCVPDSHYQVILIIGTREAALGTRPDVTYLWQGLGSDSLILDGNGRQLVRI